MHKIITTYDEIILHPNSLLVLDIDLTVIKYAYNDTDYVGSKSWKKDIMEQYNPSTNPEDDYSYEIWKQYVRATQPEFINKQSFENLLINAEKHNVKIIFLTARTYDLKHLTESHFDILGIKNKEIYYAMDHDNKGIMLDNIIAKKYNDVNNIIFVDDLLKNIKNVQFHVTRQVDCYCFEF